MFCTKCGKENENNTAYCVHCGNPLNAEPNPEQGVPMAPAAPYIPEEYKPLSPWVYFGLSVLFSIPVVGFIFMILFTVDKSNINRRNFVLSYWISMAIGVGLTILLTIFLLVLGFTFADVFAEMMYY